MPKRSSKRGPYKVRACWSCGDKHSSRKFKCCETCRAKPYIFKILVCGNPECPDGEWEWNPPNFANANNPPKYCPECREVFNQVTLAMAREIHTERCEAARPLCKHCKLCKVPPQNSSSPRVYCDTCWQELKHRPPKVSTYARGPKPKSQRPGNYLHFARKQA